MKKIFRRKPIDCCFLILPIFLVSLAWFFALADISPIWWFISLPFQAVAISNTVNSSMHWQSHGTIFVNYWHTRIYENLLTVATGKTFSGWTGLHWIHHKITCDKAVNGICQDINSPYHGSLDDNRANIWKFMIMNSVAPARRWFSLESFLKIPSLARHHVQEQWVFRFYILALFLANPVYGLFHLLLMFIGYMTDAGQGYGEHWMSIEKASDQTRNATSVYNRVWNIWNFNGGHHQEHHFSPTTHWTELPNITAKLPDDRVKIGSPVLMNLPLWQDFKELFRLSSNSKTA